jgi:uncharacterized protein YjbJ (UPF0337 family)
MTMNKLLWLVGGTALALAVFAILNAPDPAPADGVDAAAGKLGGWGTKQRLTGAGGQLFGKAEQAVGDVTGNENVSNQGAFDQAAGAVRNAAGQAAQALGSTIHDLNK